MFRRLSPDEEKRFRQWAREFYKPGQPVNPVWHPVTRAECEQMNAEQTRKER